MIKFYRELFWNICDFWEVESTQTEAHSLHKASWHGLPLSRVVLPCGHTVSRLGLFFGSKEAYIERKIMLKFQCNRSYGSPGI